MTAYWFKLPGFRPGLWFSTFNVVDGFNRQALETELDMNLPAPGIIRVQDCDAAWRSHPQRLGLNNGPEMISAAMADRAEGQWMVHFIK